jgi:hypothetical protein
MGKIVMLEMTAAAVAADECCTVIVRGSRVSRDRCGIEHQPQQQGGTSEP